MRFHYQRGEELPGGFRVLRAVCERKYYSIYEVEGDRFALCVTDEQREWWLDNHWLADTLAEKIAALPDTGFCYLTEAGYKLYTPQHGPYPKEWEDVEGFCHAFQAFSESYEGDVYPNVVYIDRYDYLLPLSSSDDWKESKNFLLGRFLTDGLPVDAGNVEKMTLFCSWLTEAGIRQAAEQCGIATEKAERVRAGNGREPGAETKVDFSETGEFCIPGREKLSLFFEHQVIDFFRNQSAYEKMGIHTVPAILLYGPPGCGKTYAVEKLTEFLGFPYYEINSESVASPYIHETGRKVAEIFQKAMEEAPSVLVIDELESYLGSRESASEHRVEEVDEFLRNIPKAIEKQVLIVGMTNHLDMIDKAVLRKGRFDQIVELDMPSQKEILNVFTNMLEELPKEPELSLSRYADSLVGHPLSDVAFVVREAARRTVRMKKEKIDDEVLSEVLNEVCREDAVQEKRRIGF